MTDYTPTTPPPVPRGVTHLGQVFAGNPTQADLVRSAVAIQAATKALQLAKRTLYDQGFAPHLQAAADQGTRYSTDVPGYGSAYVSGGKRTLVTTDEPALVAWLDEHHRGAFVVYACQVHVVDTHAVAEVHERLAAVESWDDPTRDDLHRYLEVLWRNLHVTHEAGVDLAELATVWTRRTPEDDDDRDGTGLPVAPDDQPVPHVRWHQEPYGNLTVRGDRTHLAALATQYARQLGVPAAALEPTT